jgi:ribosomal-protein-alanine N-acetyltransferase
MITNVQQITVRSAAEEDRQQLANLLHFETHVHRHLDWRPPLDWIGHEPYLIAEREGRLLAALACPPDPPNVAWIRLFAVSSAMSAGKAWEELWNIAHAQLSATEKSPKIAAIPLQSWFRKVLEANDFVRTHKVIVLAWNHGEVPPERDSSSITIRPMNFDDLSAVEEIDSAAFGSVWQNSQSCLEIAFRQAAIATVADGPQGLVGYQISTATSMGGHLARLAVHPGSQGRGIGYNLVRDMLSQFKRRGALSVTVNTQQDNLASLTIYERAGFRRTGEEYPVYQCLPEH